MKNGIVNTSSSSSAGSIWEFSWREVQPTPLNKESIKTLTSRNEARADAGRVQGLGRGGRGECYDAADNTACPELY